MREALRRLFRGTGIRHTVAPDVQGIVSLQLRNMRFEEALQRVTRECDAKYQFEQGTMNFLRQNGSFPLGNEENRSPPPLKATQDVKHLYVVRGNHLFKLTKSDLEVVDVAAIPAY